MGTQHEAHVSSAPSCKGALLALEMGTSSTCPGLTHKIWGGSTIYFTRGRPEGTNHCKGRKMCLIVWMEIAKPYWKLATKILMKIVRGVHRDLQTRRLLPPPWEMHGSFQHGETWSPEPPL